MQYYLIKSNFNLIKIINKSNNYEQIYLLKKNLIKCVIYNYK